MPVMQPALRKLLGLSKDDRSRSGPSSSVIPLRTKSSGASKFRRFDDSNPLTEITTENHIVAGSLTESLGEPQTYSSTRRGSSRADGVHVRREWDVV